MNIQESQYKGFYVDNGNQTVESKETWQIVVKTIPFKLCPEVKNITTHSWYDKDGDDEYIPATLRYKAYEMDVTFYCICSEGQANDNIRNFFKFITSGELKIYDAYTGIGRQHVRYVKYSDKSFVRRKGKDDIVEFSVTFKVNDPITNITLSDQA